MLKNITIHDISDEWIEKRPLDKSKLPFLNKGEFFDDALMSLTPLFLLREYHLSLITDVFLLEL
jgi:hypothetical protein